MATAAEWKKRYTEASNELERTRFALIVAAPYVEGRLKTLMARDDKFFAPQIAEDLALVKRALRKEKPAVTVAGLSHDREETPKEGNRMSSPVADLLKV